MSNKQFINENATVVHDSLQGLLWQRPDLERVPGTNSIVTRNINTDRVQIICGGGSGHEPAHAAMVFEGCLDGAVCGDVFASPSHKQIMTTLKHFSQCKKGILLVVKNYQGDIINFTLAAKLARIQFGIPVEVFVFGDDITFSYENSSPADGKINDRRGLAGCVLLYKVLGDMVANNNNNNNNNVTTTLSDLLEAAHAIANNTRTYGVALQSCTLPGKSGPNVEMDSTTMEFGLGIHGEAGCRKASPVPSASSIVNEMLEKIVVNREEVEALKQQNKYKPTPFPGDKETEEQVIVALNNLGGVTELEMGVLVDSLMNRLTTSKCGGDKVLRVSQLITGRFMTSLDMRGVSITIIFRRGALIPGNDKQSSSSSLWDRCLAALARQNCPTNVQFCCVSKVMTSAPGYVSSSPKKEQQQEEGSPAATAPCQQEEETSTEGKELRRVVLSVVDKIETIADRFDELDAAVGDGDMGRGVARGMRAVKAFLLASSEAKAFSTSTKQCFAQIGSVIADAFAGTSGPMIGAMIAVGGASEKVSENAADNSAASFAGALSEGVKAVRDIGGAAPGDRTMVDVLQPLADAVVSEGSSNNDSSNNNKKTLAALLDDNLIPLAKEHAVKVQALMAKKGRSRYLQERVVGKPDPGCEFVVAVLEAIRAAI